MVKSVDEESGEPPGGCPTRRESGPIPPAVNHRPADRHPTRPSGSAPRGQGGRRSWIGALVMSATPPSRAFRDQSRSADRRTGAAVLRPEEGTNRRYLPLEQGRAGGDGASRLGSRRWLRNLTKVLLRSLAIARLRPQAGTVRWACLITDRKLPGLRRRCSRNSTTWLQASELAHELVGDKDQVIYREDSPHREGNNEVG